ncbi:MAG TPA: hypothetical protein VMF91_02390 [Bryobacteraceae bacterium]|nr:hypothetical protein [Bryobacteraceae bacterium]
MPENNDEKRRRGRPPAGEHGSRVRDLPGILVRPHKAVYDIVAAVAEVKQWSLTRVVTEAISIYYLSYLRENEPRTAREVDKLIDVRRQASRIK